MIIGCNLIHCSNIQYQTSLVNFNIQNLFLSDHKKGKIAETGTHDELLDR